MFAIQVVSYGLLCMNYRAVAQAHYLWASLSDFAIATLGYFVLKHLATSASKLVEPSSSPFDAFLLPILYLCIVYV